MSVLTMAKDPAWPREEILDGIQVHRFPERVPPRPFGRLLYERLNASAAGRFFDSELAHNAYDALLLFPIDAAFGVVRSRHASRSVLLYNFTAPLSQECWHQARGLLETETRRLVRLLTLLTATHAARYRCLHQRAAILRSTAVLCPSEYSRDLLLDWMPEAGPSRAHVVPHGVDGDRFCVCDHREALRARLGWAETDIVLLTVRRLVPRMGLGQLVRGFGLAAEQDPRLRLVVVGDGPLRGRLEALARRAGGRVEFAGLIPDEHLPSYFQAADLSVVPSRSLEAFGLVILESLGCGTPAMATRRCAMPEILGPLDERLLVPRDDPKAIAESILGPGRQVVFERGFRERCREYAVTNYSWACAAERVETLIRQALTRRSAP